MIRINDKKYEIMFGLLFKMYIKKTEPIFWIGNKGEK